MQDTVVVLGAGGFLGRYICREFSRQGTRVVGVGRTPPEPAEVSGFIQGNLLELELSGILRTEKPRWLINAAGGASVGQSFDEPHADWQKTVLVQARILEALRQSDAAAFYLFLSSAAVYGEPVRLPVTEDMPCRPISPYGMHKWQAELLQEEYTRFYGLRGAVLRIFSAYGEGLQRQVVYELSQKIRRAETQIEVYGTGEETRDFIHAADVARAVYCVAKAEATGVFNVASGRQTRIAELAQQLVDQLKPGLPISFTGEGKEGNPLRWQADVSKLRQLQFHCSCQLIGAGS
jgi:UDP-glucose 4-epimerase